MAETEFELDEQGNVVTRPVLGWTSMPIAGMAILLKLDYAESEEELRTGGRALQCVLTPQQALEIAGILTTQANRILTSPKPDDPSN